MKKKRRIENRIIAVILCMAILFSQVNIADAADLNPSGTNTSQVALSDETNMSNDEASTESTVSDEINGSTESESAISEETNENSKNNESESSNGNVKAESTDNIDAYYKNSKICIYNYEQLKQIGSDAYVYTGDKDGTIGSGDVVKSEGTELKYGANAQYILMNDIQMNSEQIWSVPDSFTGTITGTEVEENETPTLYDKETDTIYIYNPYQLMVLAKEESETEPVMSLDYDAPQFGMGQMIYPDGEDQEYLTYSKSHNYVLSQKFNSDKPELVADQLSKVSAEGTEGRDFKGQVVKTIGDKTYILIGNEQQLREIGTGAQVNGAVYQAYLQGGVWRHDTDSSGEPIMLYSGDADLTREQNGVADFTFGQIKDADSKYSQHSWLHTRGRCGVDQITGEIDPDLDIDKTTGQKYTANANYIIFRDIDLSSEEWKPLTFQGTMIGAKANDNESLWDSTSSQITASMKPVLSNVKVVQSSKLNIGEQMGVGFFSTISSEVSDNDIGLSKGLVRVSNIKFENITVQTSTFETYYPETLVSTLTSTLGKLLGGVLSGLTFILTFGQVKIDLKKTLGDVLDARKKDPTALATGAIAGRVEGQVELSNLEVSSATVKNVNNNTGGFVGYIVGKTQYDGLSNALGGLVKLLTNILNVIPGLGLQNAKLTDDTSSTTAELKAYESSAKAVLMADTKTTLNTGESDTPEPSESQDPCDENIKLTINKIWKDFNNLDKKRPDNITVTISRTWTDAAGKEQTETVPEYGDYIISGSSDKSTWQEVIKGLPAYTTDENKTIHYYTYSVTETEIKGYATTIETSKDGFTFTIINRHFALLPNTGGEGIMMFIIAGGLLLAFLLYTGRRRKRKQTM